MGKHAKTKTWDRPDLSYYFDNPPPSKRTRQSPKSYREDLRPNTSRKPRESNPTASTRKLTSTARKPSVTRNKPEAVNSTAKKSESGREKRRKRSSVAEMGTVGDAEGLRGSLPGLSGKKVVQRYEQLLSESQVM